jgi:hypothetical protein
MMATAEGYQPMPDAPPGSRKRGSGLPKYQDWVRFSVGQSLRRMPVGELLICTRRNDDGMAIWLWILVAPAVAFVVMSARK